MFRAVAHSKADWLFNRAIGDGPDLKRRPQEDLVTSAIFGNLDLLEDGARRSALCCVIGQKAWQEFAPPAGSPISIALWPGGMQDCGRRVEPDVVLRCDERIMIVEVKWFAPLSEDQLGKEIRAVERYWNRSISTILLLGATELPSDFDPGARLAVSRHWRDVARDAIAVSRQRETPLGRWASLVEGFLDKTELGRIFRGLDRLPLVEIAPGGYRFGSADEVPWFSDGLPEVSGSGFEWKGNNAK